MRNCFKILLRWIEDFVAPPHCHACKVFLERRFPLCTACAARIQHVVSTPLKISETKKIMVHALGAYEEPLVAFILAKQFKNHVSAHQLGQLIVAFYGEQLPFPVDCFIPIPLHWRRYAKRGYNQAAVMARVLGKAYQVPVANLLHRKRYTAFQMTRDADERQQNVAHAFTFARRIEQAQYANKHLVLVDDLFTTGATVREAAKILFTLKPASITVIVGARVL